MSKKISLGGFLKKPAKKKAGGFSKIGGFGLQPPKKKPQPAIKKTLDVFSRAAEEDEFDRGKSAINRSLVSQKAEDKTKKLMDAAYAKAVEEDPNVFDYDGVYDEIQAKRQAAMEGHVLNAGASMKERKQSKYIGSMLEKTRIREKEQDRIFERRLLKEREEEDALFGDKEKLITASYRRKLEENKKWELEDERLKHLEEKEDVRKKKGIHDFYSNLLTKNTAMGGDVASNSTSAYTAGSKRTDDEGRISSDREKKKAKLNEMAARDVIAKKEEEKRQEEEEMEKAKQELKTKREEKLAAEAKKAAEDEKASLKAKAEAAKNNKAARLEAIKAAKARFAQRRKEQKNKPAPVPKDD